MILSNIMLISIGSTILRAKLVENSSTEALKELLNKGPLTIQMDDYGNFEKVGEIGATLPRNDARITTEPGDIILYLGSRLCLYYATNTYTFTRIGKIQDVTQEYLKQIYGEGSVNATFSLEKNGDENEAPTNDSKKPSDNKSSKTAIIAGTVSAAAVVIVVAAVTLTCYFKKYACFGKHSRSASQE